MSTLMTRRHFLKLGGGVLAGAMLPSLPLPPDDLATRPETRYGRVTTWRAWVHDEPDPYSPRVDQRNYDAIVNILDQVEGVGHYDHNPVWYRMVGGYIYSSWVQPVEYRFNKPIGKSSRQVHWPGSPFPTRTCALGLNPSLRRAYRLYYDAIFRIDRCATRRVRRCLVWTCAMG